MARTKSSKGKRSAGKGSEGKRSGGKVVFVAKRLTKKTCMTTTAGASVEAKCHSASAILNLSSRLFLGEEKTKANNKVYSQAHRMEKNRLLAQPGCTLAKAAAGAVTVAKQVTAEWRAQ